MLQIMLSKQKVEEYIAIYRNQYGKELSLAEATKHANSLIRSYKVVLPTLNDEASVAKCSNLKDSA